MSNTLNTLAAQLKAARQEKGLSQRALAERVGVPQAHVSRIEQGLVNPTVTTLDQFAEALGLEVRLLPRGLVATVLDQLAADPALRAAMDEACDGLAFAAQRHGETSVVSQMRRQLRDLLHVRGELEPMLLKAIGLLLRASSAATETETERTAAVEYLSDAAARLAALLQDLGNTCADPAICR